MKILFILCAIFLSLHAYVYCGQQSRIVLTDGSVINGEITSYQNGVYTVQTTNLGVMQVGSTKIFRIDAIANPAPSLSSPQADSPTASDIRKYKQKMLNDPESAAVITKLAADPEIQKLASDPQIQEAAKTGDIETLMKNKKFMDMVNSESMQEAFKELKQQQE